ncbi:MAG: riboflavin synthase [bacterium]|nr:riboflavin synthase [bacterium]
MFTGIIAVKTKVIQAQVSATGMKLVLAKPKAWRVRVGSSIAVNGVCSTVKGLRGGLEFDYMPESLTRANLSDLRAGDIVNIERSLKVGDRLDGHIVQGHIDTVGKIISIVKAGNAYNLKISFSNKFAKFVAEKGSITVEGVSLTVVAVSSRFFVVKIIPYTWAHTNLSRKKIGDKVNLELDILAKYLAQIIYAHKGKK